MPAPAEKMPSLLEGMGGGSMPSTSPEPDEKVAVARDILSAIKRNDAEALAAASKEMHDLCAASSVSEYPEADSEEE